MDRTFRENLSFLRLTGQIYICLNPVETKGVGAMGFLAKVKDLDCQKNFLKDLQERIEILASRKPRLKEMLKPFYENPGPNRLDQPEYWDSLMHKVIKDLKREDRIVWFLKKARGTRPAFEGKQPSDPLKSSDISQLLTDITHYIGNAEVNGYQPVLKYIFKDQKSDVLLDDLKKLTEKAESLQKEKSRLVEQGQDKTFLKFEDGWQWQLLDRSGCEREGAAMRHCGNVPSAKKGQRILSLREPITTKRGKKLWKPHATFIWNPDGSLGEMKGFSNQKPKSELHPYIVKLLEDPKITKLKGGGYAASKNFRVSDLSDDLKEALIEKRPELAPSGVDLEDLAQRIDEYIKIEVEYYSSMESLADYGYVLDEQFNSLSERDIFMPIENHLRSKVRFLLEHKDTEGLRECCVVQEFDYSLPDNSLAYFSQGEIESELPDELAEEIDDLSEDDITELRRKIDNGTLRNGFVYFEVNAGIALVLDEDQLDEKIREILEAQLEEELPKIAQLIKDENLKNEEVSAPFADFKGGWAIFYQKDDKKQELFSITVDDEDFMDEARKKIEELISENG